MRWPSSGGGLVLAAALTGLAALSGCMRASPPGSADVSVAPPVEAAPAPEVTSRNLPPPTARPMAKPVAAAATRTASPTVVVAPGDTIYTVARAHNVPIRDLIQWNGLDAPYDLSPGQVLRLPPRREHVVAAGETVYSISRGYGVDMTALTRMNGIEPPYTITVGQKLLLPSSSIVAAPQAVASTAAPAPAAAQAAAGSTVQSVPLPAPAPKPEAAAQSAAAVAPAAAPVMPVPKPGVETAALTPPAAPLKEGTFLWPLKGKILSAFGAKKGGEHNDGVNIRARLGEPVRAAAAGTVIYAGNELRGFGNLILLKHAGGWTTAYAHNERLLVARGAKVKAGQVIARAGSTGNVSSPQLHFEIRRGTRAVNPTNYLVAATAGTSVSRVAGRGVPPNLE